LYAGRKYLSSDFEIETRSTPRSRPDPERSITGKPIVSQLTLDSYDWVMKNINDPREELTIPPSEEAERNAAR
jgi:hypothetical protein